MSKLMPLLALALVVPVHAEEAKDPIDALKSGKATLELRTRYEHVEDQASKKTADALTNRLVLSYKTGSWQGLSAFAQFENVASLAEPRYFVPQTGYGRNDHATVVDPVLSQLNQLYVEFKGLKVGRQVVNADNQRFLGAVGWRQNDQTFTGATYTNATLIPKTEFSVGHLTKAHLITGVTKGIAANTLNLKFSFIPKGNLRVFHYEFEEETAKATSFAHNGLRLDGDAWKLFYDVSASQQRKFKDATDAGTKEVDYRFFGLGFRFNADFSLMAAQETLEGGFKTPYATLHAWNGWADRFLNTPANGLVDSYLQFKGKAQAFTFEVTAHSYKAETNGAKYGTELDASVEYKARPWLSVLAKAANYSADSETATLGTPNKDLKKFWLQTVMKF